MGYFDDLDKTSDRPLTSKEKAASFARGAGSAVVSAPRTVSGLLKSGAEFFREKGKEQASGSSGYFSDLEPESNNMTDIVVKALSYPEKILEKIGAPTYEEISKWHRSKTHGEDIQNRPVEGLEKGLETAGSFLGGSVLTPGASLSTPARALSSGLAAAGAGTAAGLGADEGTQLLAAIGAPSAFKFGQFIKSGKLLPMGKQAKELYNHLKSEGLTDKEIAPIMQSPTRRKILGGIAQPSDRSKKAIEVSESALGRLFDKAKNEGSKLKANVQQENKLLLRVNNIVEDLNKSKMKPDAKKVVIEKLQDFMGDVLENGLTAEEAIFTIQDVNDIIDWNSIKNGKKSLAAVKNPIVDLIKEVSPDLGNKYQKLNKNWGKLQDTAKKLSPKKYENFVKFGEVGALGKGLYSLALTGNPKTLIPLLGYKGARMLATEMLINPRLTNLMNKTLASISSGTKPSVQKAIRDFETGLKDFPEINDEIDPSVWGFED